MSNSLNIGERLVECFDQVVDVLDTHAQANGGRIDVLLFQLFGAHL